MTAGDRAIGLLLLRSPDRAFTEADERLLVNIAQLVALMLRSARLYQERTRALGELGAAQDQLVRTEKLRALGEMASGVAHDFNNLLASILGRAQLLLERVAGRQAAPVAQGHRARGHGRRPHRAPAAGLHRASGATSPRWTSISTRLSSRSSRPPSRSGGRTGAGATAPRSMVDTDLAEGLPPVAGDPAELREAFTNLVLNAVDAMPKGGRLSLRTRAVEGQVEVEVRDTGIGIPEHIREKIFDPFFTTKGPKGTGLGLSMAYGILQRHNGRITVESEEGHGTTFRMLFPAVVAGAVAAAAPPRRRGARRAGRAALPGGGRRRGGRRGGRGHPDDRRAQRGDRAERPGGRGPARRRAVRRGVHGPGDARHDGLAGRARGQGPGAGGAGGDDERIRGGSGAGGSAHARRGSGPGQAAPDPGHPARAGDPFGPRRGGP